MAFSDLAARRPSLSGLVPCSILLQGEKELDCKTQLGPSLACQPKAPTSECLFPSLAITFEPMVRFGSNFARNIIFEFHCHLKGKVEALESKGREIMPILDNLSCSIFLLFRLQISQLVSISFAFDFRAYVAFICFILTV